MRVPLSFLLLVSLVSLVACDDAGDGGLVVLGDAGGGGGGCPAGTSTCQGDRYLVCVDGRFVEQAVCAAGATCKPGLGCADCDPDQATFCDGADVVACTPDGVRGQVVQTCDDACANGACTGGCAPGNELIYVVDSDDRLHTFDPRTERFALRGRLDCPAGQTWAAFGGGPASPFSMAVDRSGRAWVLYSSGELFWVDTNTLACRRSPFQPGDGGFELFGMSFVSDAPGRPEETLFVAGGRVGQLGGGSLARIDRGAVSITAVGGLPAAEYGAELTGNANAELFAFRPGNASYVALLDKARGGEARRWALPALGNPSAWAFAHWGGRYYVFITVRDARGGEVSRVLRFDPTDGSTQLAVDGTGRRVVGAGVSTCAPVVSNF